MSQWVQKISDHITGIPRSRYECVMICSHKRVGVTLQAAGTKRRSQVTGHRAQAQVTGHRAQVIGHRKRSKNS